jgi:hypothetical protein
MVIYSGNTSSLIFSFCFYKESFLMADKPSKQTLNIPLWSLPFWGILIVAVLAFFKVAFFSNLHIMATYGLVQFASCELAIVILCSREGAWEDSDAALIFTLFSVVAAFVSLCMTGLVYGLSTLWGGLAVILALLFILSPLWFAMTADVDG